jgi:electron transport complex protein RnfB
MDNLIKSIDAILPQTQCTQCGFDGCLPYAKAIAKGTPHNQCPPGGTRVISELAKLLNREILPLNPEHGVEQPKFIAKIRETDCIGCTKCIQACPTDAIMGAAKLMHTVITSECTGCGLCVTPCPMDCIEMLEAPTAMQPALQAPAKRQADSDHYRQRHYFRKARLERLTAEKKSQHTQQKMAGKTDADAAIAAKKAYIEAALARVKVNKLSKKP